MTAKNFATAFAILAFISAAVFVSPTWQTLFRMGDVGWGLAVAVGMPLLVAIVFFLIAFLLGKLVGLARR